jgi:DNA-binding XRE family transcriptional regulator
MATVGDRIKVRRTDLGWTQEQLAGKAKISKGFLSDLENGRRNVGADTLLELATALGLSLDYLMTGEIAEVPGRPVEIPTSLAELASKEGLTFLQTRQLLGMAQQIVAHRTNTAPDTTAGFDWPKFYASVKKFLK